MSGKPDIVRIFFPERIQKKITPLGSGKINDTWLVEFAGGGPAQAVLQRINTRVFRQPEKIMANLRNLSRHLEKDIGPEPDHDADRWQTVTPYLTPGGQDLYRDGGGGVWRMLSFIDHASSFERVEGDGQAREVGRALGKFHRLTIDLDPAEFFDTLPGFHVTPQYLNRYDQIVTALKFIPGSAEEEFCAEFIEKNRTGVTVLEDAFTEGRLKRRIIHGDPKVSNIMLADDTGKAVGLVDLDTVKPGLLLYDLGDCFRSCCNPVGGGGGDLDSVRFDIEVFRSVLTGYLGEMGAYLADPEYDLLSRATGLISFELGLRYFTDHLEGDHYFRVDAPGQNLNRAVGQFLLAADILRQDGELRDAVNSCRKFQRIHPSF
ncbi:MAG: aminoglycoside phosphotransferase family protein [Proteobacteria bacterium]|nr:aminoglycoside phosphotransferase family protein [Pseudomonadota bacterium]MBU1738591.1 aminoglycoside phosphotransferase family protein [Pseudomonadota bacterium]